LLQVEFHEARMRELLYDVSEHIIINYCFWSLHISISKYRGRILPLVQLHPLSWQLGIKILSLTYNIFQHSLFGTFPCKGYYQNN
jgi:hypothetical protein